MTGKKPDSKPKYLHSEAVLNKNGDIAYMQTVATDKPTPEDISFEKLVKELEKTPWMRRKIY